MARGQNWTETERGHLEAHYRAISARDLRALIPNRTEQAIRNQAGRMDLKKCHERLRDMGRENVLRRWERVAFKDGEIQA